MSHTPFPSCPCPLPLSEALICPLSCFEKVHIAYLFFFFSLSLKRHKHRHKHSAYESSSLLDQTQWERCSHNLNFYKRQWEVSRHVQNIKYLQSPRNRRPFHIYIYIRTIYLGQRQKQERRSGGGNNIISGLSRVLGAVEC